jgi:hypothetical protein
MKFSVAWANVAAQNVTLKAGVTALAVSTLALAVTSAKLALRPPLIIDRACYSRTVTGISSPQHSNGEIETFVRDALAQRFNSDTGVTPGFISLDEERLRVVEQRELSSRGMSQKMVVNVVKVVGDQINVDADRLISVGMVRSAFPFPLNITLGTVNRTESNPAGLLLSKITQLKVEGSK